MLRDGLQWASLKRAKRCLGCGHDFADGEGYFSMIFMGGEAIAREDYCASCRERVEPGKRERYISYWQGRFKAAPPRQREEPIAKSTVERLLRKYLNAQDPSHVNFRYILALMMERKKRLVPRDRVIEPGTGKSIIVYELPDSGESFFIEDPGLGIHQAKEVQKQVRDLLALENVSSGRGTCRQSSS